MEGWGGLGEQGSTERETDAEYTPSNGHPLTNAEKLAAFLVMTKAIDAGGCQVGFGRITREDENSLDMTFSLTSHMVRKVVAAFPDDLVAAEQLLAS